MLDLKKTATRPIGWRQSFIGRPWLMVNTQEAQNPLQAKGQTELQRTPAFQLRVHTCLLLKELHHTLAQSPYQWKAEILTLNFEHVVHPNPPNHLSRESQHHRDREASRSRAYFIPIYQIYWDTSGEDSAQCVNTHAYPPIDVEESARRPRQCIYSGLQSRAEELLCTIGTDGC